MSSLPNEELLLRAERLIPEAVGALDAGLNVSLRSDLQKLAEDLIARKPARPPISERNDLVRHCEMAVQFYKEKPGLNGVGATIDLYILCKELAERVVELEGKVQQLLEPVK